MTFGNPQGNRKHAALKMQGNVVGHEKQGWRRDKQEYCLREVQSGTQWTARENPLPWQGQEEVEQNSRRTPQ